MKRTHSETVKTLPCSAARAFAAALVAVLAAGAQETNRPVAAGPAEADAFRIISQRNIFDPNRSAVRAESRAPTSTVVETFALVGTLSYGKGDFAFFDGTASDYRKALGTTGTVAGFTVAAITATGVTMVAGDRRTEMKVGAQMRRDGDGAWQMETGVEWRAAAPTTAPAASAGEANDVLRKLMQQREQELK